MNIAENKKRNNISEYIIHMYQTEDLIRVYDFDMEQIKKYVIKHIPTEDGNKEEISKWYEDIMEKMKIEGIEEKGHLDEVQNYVAQLSKIMNDLKKSDESFKKIYSAAKPHIDESISFSNGIIKEEVQACLNGIYGLLLARLNGRQVPEEVMVGINTFGDVLSYLTYKYKQKNFLNDN
ncbi:DUF4924 family protein [Fulvivirga sp. 29W222]|uniref:DUF4924 family protein n=1 Tax=Fulvivirga marina TaxID=2494733 RepID=A0A937G0R5_9BACT|nr:DUF4924 family protein [Fulvivirga marina]MBL6447870.1 DUF4924 family protein [Fulvivirga marina]